MNGEYHREDLAQRNEHRITKLEAEMAEVRRLLEKHGALWLNFVGSTSGGIVTGLVIWWMTKQ